MDETIVGVITRSHGVRGEVVVDIRTDEPKRRFVVGARMRTDSGVELEVAGVRRAHERWLVQFTSVDNRDEADELRGEQLWLAVPETESTGDDNEFYDRHLIGCDVVDAAGNLRGVVTGVNHLGAQDLLVVDVDGIARLVPFVSELVPSVDITARVIEVADIAGLLDDEDDE